MAGPVFPSGLHNVYGEQLALTTTAASLGMPGIETKQALVYVPSTDFRMSVNPAVLAIWFYDNTQTGVAKWVNLKTDGIDLTDRTSTGSGTALDAITVDDRLLICFSDVVGGFRVDMTASVNDTASRVMVGEYPLVAAWTGLSVTDGTIVATAKSLAQDGSVTFTAPTDWRSNHFNATHQFAVDLAIDDVDTAIDIGTDPGVAGIAIVMDADPSSAILAGDHILVDTEVMRVHSSTATGNIVNVVRAQFGSTAAAHTAGASVFIYRFDCPDSIDGYWVKLNWTGGTLAADVEIQDMWSLNKNPTNYGFFRAGVEYSLSFNRTTTGALEFDLAAGTDTADITWLRVAGG